MSLNTNESITNLKGVGPQMAIKLAKLHIHSSRDLLFYLPFRYEDRTKVTEIGSLSTEGSAVVIGEIQLAQVVFGRRRSLLVRISDGTGNLTIRLFYFSRSQEKSFKRGSWVQCFGALRRGSNSLEMIHPEYKINSSRDGFSFETCLTPIYPTTEGISQSLWRKLTEQALKISLPLIEELLTPQMIQKSLGLDTKIDNIHDAIRSLHRPTPNSNLSELTDGSSSAHLCLIFEELLAHHFSIKKARLLNQMEKADAFLVESASQKTLLNSFGFELTSAQIRVKNEVARDLAKTTPMMRLVQGDVGSGKTVIAALALLHAAISNVQSVLMAPTELLAEQHYKVLTKWFANLNISVGWLSSKTPAKQKKQTLESLENGELLIVVGTHAVMQESVIYNQLGLLVIDEQHRFGVDQRLALRNKSKKGMAPHQLMMTATPIPRTLAMSIYADLDVSNIDELPPGRKIVETVVMSAQDKRQQIIERVNQACKNDRQVYWVCPLIDESELLSAQAATETQVELSNILNKLSVGLVHGRMKPKEKESTMLKFRNGDIDVLVATTVIEVGVDVPNASLMIIENSERMGLSQLHQLRGRVGRDSQQSYCILMYQEPLSQHARKRLEIMRKTNDGFIIAEKDLEMRGAGEMLGTRQTGSLSFKIADIMRDQHLLPHLTSVAKQMSDEKPNNIEPLIDRWIGSREGYVNA